MSICSIFPKLDSHCNIAKTRRQTTYWEENHIMPSMAMCVCKSTFAIVKFLLQLKTYLGSVMYDIFLGLKVNMLHKIYNLITSRLNRSFMKFNSDIT
jgi:hypothetical protein